MTAGCRHRLAARVDRCAPRPPLSRVAKVTVGKNPHGLARLNIDRLRCLQAAAERLEPPSFRGISIRYWIYLL